MPCDSSYLAPRDSEIESKRCAENIRFTFNALDIRCPLWVRNASISHYGNEDRLEEMVIILCDLCTKMTDKQKEKIIYNGKCKESRQLADWWDEHQEADKERKEKEYYGRNIS